MKKKLIVKHNKIIESKYNMTMTEIKIIAKLSSMIRKDDEDFKKHIFKAQDLLSELGLGEKNYALLQRSVDKLLSRVIEIKLDTYDKKGKRDILRSTFLSSCIYQYSTSEIILSYDPELKPYLLQLKNNFTKYHLINILGLKSFYAVRIYELCKQYENTKQKERTIKIEELKEILEIENKYNKYSHLKEKVLEISKREINLKTDININFEEIKTGRKITSIKFTVKRKEIRKLEIEKKVYSEEVVELFELVKESEKTESIKESIEKLLNKYSYEVVESNISYTNKKSNTNYQVYLKNALNSDYAKSEREKNIRKKVIQKKQETEKKEFMEKEEKINLENLTETEKKYLERANKIVQSEKNKIKKK